MEQTKFQRWVRQYGVNKLARDLSAAGVEYEVTFSAVYQWVRGEHEPRGPKIRELVRLSAGALTLEDIHAHFDQLRRVDVVGP